MRLQLGTGWDRIALCERDRVREGRGCAWVTVGMKVSKHTIGDCSIFSKFVVNSLSSANIGVNTATRGRKVFPILVV